MFPVFPSETSVVAAGVLAGTDRLALEWVLAAAAAGAFLGDNLTYLIGRRFGRPATAGSSPKGRVRRSLTWAEHQLDERGAYIIIVARFIPGGPHRHHLHRRRRPLPLPRFLPAPPAPPPLALPFRPSPPFPPAALVAPPVCPPLPALPSLSFSSRVGGPPLGVAPPPPSPPPPPLLLTRSPSCRRSRPPRWPPFPALLASFAGGPWGGPPLSAFFLLSLSLFFSLWGLGFPPLGKEGSAPSRGDEPVPPAARRQPRGLVPVGRGGAIARPRRGQADPALDRVRRLPLVPRHGARVVRGRRDRRR